MSSSGAICMIDGGDAAGLGRAGGLGECGSDEHREWGFLEAAGTRAVDRAAPITSGRRRATGLAGAAGRAMPLAKRRRRRLKAAALVGA